MSLALLGVGTGTAGGGGSSQPSTGSEVAIYDAGEVTGLSDGDTSATWEDETVNSNDLAAGGSNVVWRDGTTTAGPNGEAFFDFASNRFADTFSSTYTQPVVILAVLRDNFGTGTHYLFDGASTSTRCALFWTSGNYNMFAGAGAAVSVSTDDTEFDAWSIVRARYDGSSSNVFKNGAQVGSNVNPGSDDVDGITLNSLFNGNFQGQTDFAFVVVLDSPSAQDVTDWESYLATRYGITLP